MKKDKKHIYKHCYNCKCFARGVHNYYCAFKHTNIEYPRMKALLCRCYNQKEIEK